MNAQDYEQFRAQLAEAGFRESEARYEESAFGSWWVCLEHEPRLRVMWDGKDGWLFVQREAVEDGWEDVWVAKTPPEQTPEELIRALAAL